MRLNKISTLFFLFFLSFNGLSQNGAFYDSTQMFLPDGIGVQYQSDIIVSGFPGEQITSAGDIAKVALTIEHSFLGDLEVGLQCPNGTMVALINSYDPGFFLGGFSGGGRFLGDANDQFSGSTSGPGIGWEYAFSSVLNTWGDMPTEAAANNTVSTTLSSGNAMNPNGIYLPEDSFFDFIGCPIDGTWSLIAIDNWAADDGYIFSWGIELNQTMFGHHGFVFQDFNQNCTNENNEIGVNDITVIINPGNYVVQTNSAGAWYIDSLPIGTYTVTVDTTTSWTPTCAPSVSFDVVDPLTFVESPPIGMLNENPCSEPNISVVTAIARPCFPTSVSIQARNARTGTEVMTNTLIDVQLDPSLSITGATLTYTDLGNNLYQFDVGDIAPGHTKNITITALVDCQTIMGMTICNEAKISPISPCTLDTIPGIIETYNSNGQLPQPCALPWDQSSLVVNGWCQNDSIHFEVTNNGSPGAGDMDCYTSVVVFRDTSILFLDSLNLAGGASQVYSFPAAGNTWIMKVPQHPLHPGNSNPMAFVELCGSLNNWTPNIINQYALDDADPFIDINCLQLTASYDPNDKQGFPLGLTDEHRISQGQELEYLIRFQNTGTDTAFTVVIRDTLDPNFNIFSVETGAASHDFSFKILNDYVLEWTFNNILLPDSSTNLVESNGFVSFKVNQNPNLPYGTVLNNEADIYFDFNPPIITNKTSHLIYKGYLDILNLEEVNSVGSSLLVFPNPVSSSVHIQVENELIGNDYKVFDVSGKLVEQGKIKSEETEINFIHYEAGFYFLRIGNKPENVVKLIKR